MKLRNIIIILLMFSSIIVIGANPENKNAVKSTKSNQGQTINKSGKKTDTSTPAKKETKTNEKLETKPNEKNDSYIIEKKYSNAIKRIESLEKEISNLKNTDNNNISQEKLDNSIDRIYMFLYIISGGFLLIIIFLSIIFYRYLNKELDYINNNYNTNIKIGQGKKGNNLNWELENQLKRIRDAINILNSKIEKLEKEEKSIKPIIEIKNNQTQNPPKNKFLYAESPDDLIFSKFGKEPSGRYIYAIDTLKNTFTIDESLKDVIRNVDKLEHACIVEYNDANFSRYEIKEGKVKKIDDNSWEIIEKIKLKLY